MAMRIGSGEKELVPILKKEVRDANRVIEKIDSASESFGNIWQHTLRGGAGGAGLGLIFEQTQYNILSHLPHFISNLPLIHHIQVFFSSQQNDILVAAYTMIFAGAVGGILTFVNNVRHEIDSYFGKKSNANDQKRSRKSVLAGTIANNAVAGIGVGLIGEQIAQKFVLQYMHYVSNLQIFEHLQRFFVSPQNDLLAIMYSATIAGIVGVLTGTISAFAKGWSDENENKEKGREEIPLQKPRESPVVDIQNKEGDAELTLVPEKRAA